MFLSHGVPPTGVLFLDNLNYQIRGHHDPNCAKNSVRYLKLTRSFLPYIRKGIINIASAAGKTAYAEMSVYCGTKFGVRGFTQALAEEHTRLKICCVNPDMTATRLTGYEGRPPSDVAG